MRYIDDCFVHLRTGNLLSECYNQTLGRRSKSLLTPKLESNLGKTMWLSFLNSYMRWVLSTLKSTPLILSLVRVHGVTTLILLIVDHYLVLNVDLFFDSWRVHRDFLDNELFYIVDFSGFLTTKRALHYRNGMGSNRKTLVCKGFWRHRFFKTSVRILNTLVGSHDKTI